MVRAKQVLTPQGNNDGRESSAASTVRVDRIQVESTNDEASVTEKHEYNIRNQEDNHTQDPESMSADCTVKVNVGSDVKTAGTAVGLDGDTIETERVLETESPASDANVSGGRPTGDTIPFDDDVLAQENGPTPTVSEEKSHTNDPHRAVSIVEVTESTGIRSDDLLTSEVAGSWAIDTAPSVHGENDYPRTHDRDDSRNYGDAADALMCLSECQAAESQVAAVATKLSQEHQALNAMIGAMAPDFKEHFGEYVSSRGREEADASISDSDTEENSDNDDDVEEVDAVGRPISDEDNTKAGNDQGNIEGRDEADASISDSDTQENSDNDDVKEVDAVGRSISDEDNIKVGNDQGDVDGDAMNNCGDERREDSIGQQLQ